MRRALLLALLLACSKSTKQEDPPKPIPRDAGERMFPVRQLPPSDDETVEVWSRDIAEPKVSQYHGVEAVKSRTGKWPWQVGVWVMEHIRDVPLEDELRHRIIAALRAVPGVVEVIEGDRELWLVRGEPKGLALVDAVAPVVDELAPQAKQEVQRNLAE